MYRLVAPRPTGLFGLDVTRDRQRIVTEIADEPLRSSQQARGAMPEEPDA